MSPTARTASASATPPAVTLAAKPLPRFRPTLRTAHRLRLALVGASGAGKTVTALRIATALVAATPSRPAGRLAVLDTDHGKALRYAGSATPFGFSFDGVRMTSFHPLAFVEAIRDAEREGCAALVIDTLSHAWIGEGGVLDLVDQLTRKGAESRAAWAEARQAHRAMMEALLTAKLHVIVTIRTKMEHAIEPVGPGGAMAAVRRGTTPQQDDGIAYDFDIAALVNENHEMIVQNTICCALEGKVFPKAGPEVAEILGAWLSPEELSENGVADRAAAVPGTPRPRLEGTVNGMTAQEDRAMREIDPALKAASAEDEIEALRHEAVLAMPLDPGNREKRLPSPAFHRWYQAAFGRARKRVAGR